MVFKLQFKLRKKLVPSFIYLLLYFGIAGFLYQTKLLSQNTMIYPTGDDTLYKDINNDGLMDQVIRKTDGTILYMKNLGHGHFLDVRTGSPTLNRSSDFHRTDPDSQYYVDETAERLPNNNQLSSKSAVGDVDGDGDLDILVGNSPFGAGWSGQDRLLINDGNGYFTDETANRWPQENEETGGFGLGDFDSDGDLDIVCSYPAAGGGGNIILMNDGDGYFTDETADRFPDISNQTIGISVADVNNDLHLDLLFANVRNWENRIYLNDGYGYFTDATAELFPDGSDTLLTFDMLPVDVDGDFDLDLVVVNYTNSPSTCQPNQLWINDGSGHYFVEYSFAFGEICEANSNAQSYDITHEGFLDIFMSSINNKLLLINDSCGNFINEGESRIPSDRPTVFLAVGDVTNTGQIDVYCGNGLDNDQLYFNTGNGYYTDVTNGHLPSTSSSSTRSVNLADYDWDGDLDVFLATTGDLQNRLLINYGVGSDTFPPIISHQVDSGIFVDSSYSVTVRTRVTDNQIWIEDVKLFLKYAGYTEFDSLNMSFMGGHLYQVNLGQLTEGSIFEYYFKSTDYFGNVSILPSLAPDSIFQTNVILKIDNLNEGASFLPNLISLKTFPNPFNDQIKIMYELNFNSNIEINIYDIKGHPITPLLKKYHKQGMYNIEWNGLDKMGNEVASGNYIINVSGMDDERKRIIKNEKILLLK